MNKKVSKKTDKMFTKQDVLFLVRNERRRCLTLVESRIKILKERYQQSPTTYNLNAVESAETLYNNILQESTLIDPPLNVNPIMDDEIVDTIDEHEG